MTGIIRDTFSGILDLVYPPFCLVCGDAGDGYLCAKCIEGIDIIGPQRCRKCGTPTERYICSDCDVREYAFEGSASAGVYDGTLRKAIHALKYENRIVLADPLAELMVRCFPNTGLRGMVDIVLPVPIHRSRMLERGFNQAYELARRLSAKTGLPVKRDILVKTRKTPHQADLPQDLRYANVQNVFAVTHPDHIRAKRVLLIDDVFTTGSTLSESAQVLLDAGASEVWAYTLARSI